jgi:hypothetical protein
MRATGLLCVLVAGGALGCSFGSPSAGPRVDAAVDAPSNGGADAARIDAAIDGPASRARRKSITVDAGRVSGSQVAFPVWISLVDSDLKMKATANGADIHFTNPNGTSLPYQIQRWDPQSGRLEAWVRLNLDDNVNTVLELRYGDAAAAATHPPDPVAVFSSSFLAVWHLDDRLMMNTIAEATSQVPGTAQGGLGPADQVTGQLGGGIDFDGVDDRITFTNPFSGGGSHTISAWVNQRAANGFDSIVTVGNPMQGQSRWFHAHHSTNTMGVGFYGPDYMGQALPNIDGDGWVLVHWVFDSGGNRTGRIYLNGAEVGNDAFNNGTINTQGTGGHLGYALDAWGPGGNTPCALNGILDEVRLSNAVRSAGWIATEYANQNSPQTFYTVGPEQTVP